MLSRKDFFFYNVFISCLVLFFPLYEFYIPKKVLNFLYFDIYNLQNFIAYCFICYFNINIIYLLTSDKELSYLIKALEKFNIERGKENAFDFILFYYILKLKFIDLYFFLKTFIVNKFKSCYSLFLYLNFFLYF